VSCLQVEPEPLGEQGTGESGRARQALTEASTAKMQLVDDQRCPTVSEDLGATGDGAVLTVRPHDASVTPPALRL
jgi:hypothetical protein